MVESEPPPDPVFDALADPTRRRILQALARGEASVGDLARPLPMSLQAVSKHVRVLERAGLVSRRRQGRRQVVKLQPAAVRAVAGWCRGLLARPRAAP